jgi:rhodanese-related sulfurtransferase
LGPLVPDIITDQTNLVIALLLGIAFGFVLEQAGFSSSRKLTGLFYGTDFTVLRVFFTAGVTAMSGVLLLNQFGWLDADLIYINPMFLHSAILGGAIMGVGFVVGGYCPGTSFCGAAIGRIDAMAFVGGGLLGILGFGEAFPLVESFYKAGSQGDLLVSTALGISNGQFAAAMILVAVGAFIVTTRLEKKINAQSGALAFPIAWHRVGGALLIILAVVLAAVPDRKIRLTAEAASPAFLRRNPIRTIAPDELAIHLLDRDPKVQLVDVRDTASFTRSTLPGAIHVGSETLFGKQAESAIADARTLKIFFGRSSAEGTKAAALARLNGYENIAALESGYDGFMMTVMNGSPDRASLDADTYVFRERARSEIQAMLKRQTATKTPAVVKRVQGGCGG